MASRAPRSPTTFVVARHLISHPEDRAADLARHCNLNLSPASRARRHIIEETALEPLALLEVMKRTSEKPSWKTFHFKAPNPDQILSVNRFRSWISGEHAAAMDGFDLVPEKLLVYVKPEDIKKTMRATQDIFAKPSPPIKANLTIRVADPWLWLVPESDLVERGQRFYDYQQSGHIQILRGLHGA